MKMIYSKPAEKERKKKLGQKARREERNREEGKQNWEQKKVIAGITSATTEIAGTGQDAKQRNNSNLRRQHREKKKNEEGKRTK